MIAIFQFHQHLLIEIRIRKDLLRFCHEGFGASAGDGAVRGTVEDEERWENVGWGRGGSEGGGKGVERVKGGGGAEEGGVDAVLLGVEKLVVCMV